MGEMSKRRGPSRKKRDRGRKERSGTQDERGTKETRPREVNVNGLGASGHVWRLIKEEGTERVRENARSILYLDIVIRPVYIHANYL